MDKKRRTKLHSIIITLETMKKNLNDVLEEEKYKFDCMPENLQGSRRGTESEDAIDAMEESVDTLGKIINDLNSI